jgi:hypothetical protein
LQIKLTTELMPALTIRPSLAVDIVALKKAFDAKGRGVKFRYVTEITSDIVSYRKELLTIGRATTICY